MSKTEFEDLAENLKNGIAISTPVFDGAKEKNVNINPNIITFKLKLLNILKNYEL